MLDAEIIKQVRQDGYYETDTILGYNGQTKIRRLAVAATLDGRLIERQDILSTDALPVLELRRELDRNGEQHGLSQTRTRINGIETVKLEQYDHGRYTKPGPDANFSERFDEDLAGAAARFAAREDRLERQNRIADYLSNAHSAVGRPFASHRTLGRAYRRIIGKSL